MVLGIQHTALFFAAINNKPGLCLPSIAKGADLRVRNSPSNQSPLSHYGFSAYPHPAPLVKAQRVAELEAAFRAGCHPSQVRPRKDENWAKRWPPDECGERAARLVRRALQQRELSSDRVVERVAKIRCSGGRESHLEWNTHHAPPCVQRSRALSLHLPIQSAAHTCNTFR